MQSVGGAPAPLSWIAETVLGALGAPGGMLGHFPFTLPHELGDGQRRRVREVGEAA